MKLRFVRLLRKPFALYIGCGATEQNEILLSQYEIILTDYEIFCWRRKWNEINPRMPAGHFISRRDISYAVGVFHKSTCGFISLKKASLSTCFFQWWRRSGSNQWPPHCQCGALPNRRVNDPELHTKARQLLSIKHYTANILRNDNQPYINDEISFLYRFLYHNLTYKTF